MLLNKPSNITFLVSLNFHWLLIGPNFLLANPYFRIPNVRYYLDWKSRLQVATKGQNMVKEYFTSWPRSDNGKEYGVLSIVVDHCFDLRRRFRHFYADFGHIISLWLLYTWSRYLQTLLTIELHSRDVINERMTSWWCHDDVTGDQNYLKRWLPSLLPTVPLSSNNLH